MAVKANDILSVCGQFAEKHVVTRMSASDLLRRLNSHGALWLYNEVFADGQLTRVYLDADKWLVDEPSPADIGGFEQDCLDDARRMWTPFVPSGVGADVTVRMATRHRWAEASNTHGRRFKLSVRCYLPGIAIVYTDIRRVIDEFKDDAKVDWDASVYKKAEQLLNCIKCFKTNCSDPSERLTPRDPDAPLEDYLVAFLSGREHLVVLPPPILPEQPPSPSSVRATYPTPDETSIRRDLEALAQHRVDLRETWIQCGMILRHECDYGDEFFDAWVDWSRKSSKFQGEEECRKAWRSFRRPEATVKPLTRGTLKMWVKEDSPEPSCGVLSTAVGIQSSVMDMDTAGKLNQLLNVQGNCEWQLTPADGGLKLTPVSLRQCLVDASAMHDGEGHSTIFIDNRQVCINCMVHNQRRVPKNMARQMRDLLQAFGVISVPTAVEPTPFMTLRDKVVNYASAQKLRKLDGNVYKRLVPCAYEIWMSYEKFINHVLRGDQVYNSTPRMFGDVHKFLTSYDEDGFRNIEVDRDLISFSNGVLRLSTREFTPYDEDPFPLEGRIARHHIDRPFTGSTETPLFDGMVMYQFHDDADTYNLLLTCIGRLFFEVGEHDNWQVMPFLYGDAATGKSTLIDVVKGCFSGSSIATLTNNMEVKFGLEGKHEAELMIAPDIPKEMHNVIDQQIWQNMVSGEDIQVPRKNQRALSSVKWRVPQLWAGNVLPDYKDHGGCVSRRLIVFNYRRWVDSSRRDTTLLRRILSSELPALVLKSIEAYFASVHDHGDTDVWSWCPDSIRESQALVRGEADFLYRFLTAAPEDNASSTKRYYVMHQEGVFTDLSKLKEVFRLYMRFKHPEVKYTWPEDESSFKQLGYGIERKQLCKTCGRPHKKDTCGDHYHSANRTCKSVIKDLLIVMETYDPVECVWTQ